MNCSKGFTLIELMVVVAIIAILAAIAIPSYQRYAIENTQNILIQKMLKINGDTNRWRAKALTYKGFMPDEACKEVPDTNAGAGVTRTDCTATTFCVPSSSDCRYEIALKEIVFNSTGSTIELNKPLSDTDALGMSWRMVATPKSSWSYASKANKYLLTSTGVRLFEEPTSGSAYTSLGITSPNSSWNANKTW